MFQSLAIQHFRGFGKLALEGIGRVNLVVGKNNTGKTSLLEAITLLADPGTLKSLPDSPAGCPETARSRVRPCSRRRPPGQVHDM